MRKDKEDALRLRRQGKSYAEISGMLGVSKSTLSEWLSPLKWSENIKDTLKKQAIKSSTVRIEKLNRRRGKELKKLYKRAEKEAYKEYNQLKYHPLFIASLAAYLGEGERSSRYKVAVSNSEPHIPAHFRFFLSDICQISCKDLFVEVFLYENLNKEVCLSYWGEILDLPMENFSKPVTLPSRTKKRSVDHGICRVGIRSTYLKKKIDLWVELLSKDLLEEEYYLYKRV